MHDVIIGITTSLFAAIIYALSFHKNEDHIRAWLVNAPVGLLRTFYVKAFIGAVRGKAREAETSALNQMLLVYPLAVFFTFIGFETRLEFTKAASTNDLSRLQEIIAREKSKQQSIKSDEAIAKEEASLLEDINNTLKEGDAMLWKVRLVIYAAFIWFGCLLTVVIPFRTFRSRFSYELDRFIDCLRVIATREQITSLMQKEARVRDEKVLKLLPLRSQNSLPFIISRRILVHFGFGVSVDNRFSDGVRINNVVFSVLGIFSTPDSSPSPQ